MKRILFFLSLVSGLFVSGCLLSSCDKIDEPYTRGTGGANETPYRLCIYLIEDSIVAPQKNNDPSVGPTPDWLDYVHNHLLRTSLNGTWGSIFTGGIDAEADDTVKVTKKVLLEDFTGHLCINCPSAAEKAKELKTIYGENLYIIAHHAGEFAEPQTSGNYTADFRNPSSNELYAEFGITYNPVGLINRHEFNSQRRVGAGQWAAKIGEMMNQKTDIKITFSKNYQALTGLLEGNVKVRISGKWFTQPFSIFMNVYDTNNWNANNCKLVAFVYEESSREIYQVEETDVYSGKK
ncbi:MAG: Omp28-related outer membrane protein [Lentimicrobiaceae bacterium]|nr:Omp28-related outer membrane protein [Lentimicrobiaceae bacterium]